jgi:hypothetical protein
LVRDLAVPEAPTAHLEVGVVQAVGLALIMTKQQAVCMAVALAAIRGMIIQSFLVDRELFDLCGGQDVPSLQLIQEITNVD